MENPESPSGAVRLACPFLKRNPLRPPKAASCYFPGFSSIARLKEHIYREHSAPNRCGRCFQKFGKKAALHEHLRENRRCEKRQEDPELQIITDDQEASLRSKKRSRGLDSEEDKWQRVFLILFPEAHEASIPDPYCQYPQPLPESQLLSRFQQFSRDRLPLLLDRELELATQGSPGGLADLTNAQVLEAVRVSQEKLFTLFGRNGNSSSIDEDSPGFPVPTLQHNAEQGPLHQPPAATVPGTMLTSSEGVPGADALSAEALESAISTYQNAHGFNQNNGHENWVVPDHVLDCDSHSPGESAFGWEDYAQYFGEGWGC
ncbi:uncharacterized protein BKCO1_6600045 [Diplodia corticola]|uniref:C2H2-type domain-containing protein n=1 Tax=Diplodia corticola TaxID=236234 RepID=A0A1J9QMN3_9PEZI|nr:uncharacterized protein BKCO1_6600045 [Diplodia corticola]OJD30134.1 hypothetical protein BKCO1_6600045 [Diplodia corticola]